MLPVRFRGVELNLTLEPQSFRDRVRDVRDRHLVLLADGQDDRVRLVVTSERPHHESREVFTEYELPQRLPGSPDLKRLAFLFTQVSAVDQPRDHVRVLEVEVIVLPEDVRRDHGRELHPVLVSIHSVLHVHHALRVRVPLVAKVRRAVVDHRLVDRERRLVRENARAEARHELFYVSLVALLEDVVVHDDVVPPELYLVLHIREQTADLGGEVDHVRGHVLVEYRGRLYRAREVSVPARQVHPPFV
mmetsp:Transcript_11598/g.41722  ORF Transcript_11598/g.41722 Transcript_11598/m.41722 type:complete len:247 (-) Transcript_11598:200-940(-)